MSTIAFDAMVVSGSDPDEGVFLVGFSDDPAQPSQYLLLQRSLDPDNQDRSLGQDSYHFEWCGQDHSMYGGIEEFNLSPSKARVRFSPEAIAIGVPSDLVIGFNLSAAEFQTLDRGLELIFSGSGCLFRAIA